MGLHRDFDDYMNSAYSDIDQPEDQKSLSHKRELRKKIEDRLESKRLKEACRDEWDDWDELGEEFDWDQIDK